MSSMFHEGQRALQDTYGGRAVADRLEQHRKRSTFADEDRKFIEGANFFFLATAYGDSVDCSFKGGLPGFVKIIGPSELCWPDYDGNRMYRSLGNISKSPAVGLLFISFDKPNEPIPPSETRRLRVNGGARIVDAGPELDELKKLATNAKRFVVVTVKDIFTNCHRYLPDMAVNEQSIYSPRPGYTPPQPEWKSRDYIKDVLNDD